MENTLNTRINAAPAIETNNDADLIIHPSDGHFELLITVVELIRLFDEAALWGRIALPVKKTRF